MTALLTVEDLDVRYGDAQALFGVDVTVEAGETLAVIGANGAGKSTLLKTIAGLLRPGRGRIRFDGRDITGLPAHRRAPLGIALVPEGRRLFPSLTVEENLLIGAGLAKARPDRIYELFPHLVALRRRGAGLLSGGEQQAVAIGRALMSDPRLLLLDEVSLGLAPIVVKQLYAVLPAITAAGTTVLLVEQDVNQALAAADRVQCLLEGRVALEAAAGDVSRAAVTRAYFGV
ncbi:ABC transporter ATP-binding protein [Paractinoplanes toevensis]|uniref:ABC transporter ATP-binding protein n=1 Tax=Paractinoplanes toevensis TaxID=571911 RepID=A0A919T981_9ACTN|nr:ABC transporter ATP-binding protein [Actinoplanes toevensis]GIM90205.1 ABC transporter ATP-binding protein [Actinoplanes toevensis]